MTSLESFEDENSREVLSNEAPPASKPVVVPRQYLLPFALTTTCSLTEEESKLGSAFLIMAIVGGAVLTKLQGSLIGAYSVRTSFWLPAICFVLIALYGIRTFMKFEREANTAS